MVSSRLAAALARLDASVDWERRDRAAGMRVDLEPIRRLCAGLGHPERAYRTVHVAGSKGKGSTAAWIAAGLGGAGRVGRYGSPHVERINERIAIEGRDVSDEVLAECLEAVLEVEAGRPRGAEPATWFDLVTAAGFLALAHEQVDWAVIEVGLGGRLDSTNVVLPELCVITNIELEHTEVLGDTRAAIAAEKAGILKPDVWALCGLAADDEAGAEIAARARAVGAPLEHWTAPSAAAFPEVNRGLGLAALARLGAALESAGAPLGSLDPARLERLAAPTLPGRLERVAGPGGIPAVLDGAHTPDSLAALLAACEPDSGLPGPPCVVLGMGRSKDSEAMLKVLRGRVDSLFCTSVDPRTHFSSEELAAKARGLGMEATNVSEPWCAVQAAAERSADRWMLVTGSLHLVGAVRPRLLRAQED